MEKKIRKFQSIRVKIIIMLIMISLIPITIMGLSSYTRSKNVLKNNLETTSEQTLKEISRGIDNYFLAMSNLIQVISADSNVEEFDDPLSYHYAKQFLVNVKETDDVILGVFVGTQKGLYYTYPEIKVDANYDFTTRDWYIDAMEHQGEVVITKPYISTTTGKMVVSIARTVEKDNKVVGVTGMNIDLDLFSKELSEIKVGNSGYVFIVDADGIMIAHPDQKLVGTDEATTLSFWPEAAINTEGFESYKYQGEDKFGGYYTSDSTGWKIMSSMYQSELTSDTQAILNIFYVLFLLISISAIIIAIQFSKPIAKNVKMILEAMSKVSHGDLSVDVTIKSRDEFSTLGNHFNEMLNNISNLIYNVQNSSATVHQTSVMLKNMAEETNSSVNEVARAVEEVANGAAEQANNSVESVNSISELADKLNLVEEATDEINDLSINASELTNQGLMRVETLIKTSNETKDSTAKISELVFSMSESMKQINAISDTINNITAQTNLLALNASIEAARAGEAGKGFAVVADEIRNLAEQSKLSTIQIKGIVDEIQEQTKSSVEAMNQTDQNVKEQVAVVDQTQFVFQDIMKAVSNLSKKIIEIKDFTTEIAIKKENIIHQIENISAISEESASATEEVTASTEEISVTMDEVSKHANDMENLAEDLQNNVKKFKLKM